MAELAQIRCADVALPSLNLENANWADAYEIVIARADLSALDVVKAGFSGKQPGWIKTANAVRNWIVGFIGLKSGEISIDADQVGSFPVLYHDPRLAVLGFDDWHLNFRIVVEAMPEAETTHVRLSTVVNRKNLFGYVYIFLITPFHKLIVKTLLRQMEKQVFARG